MKRLPLITLVCLAWLLLAAGALAGDLKDEPGFVDLEWIRIPAHAVEVEDIDLSAVLLSIAADAEMAEDPDLAKALAMVKSIRVKAFSLEEGDTADAEEAVARIERTLEQKGWSRLIYVKEDEETTTVSTRRKDGDLVGLMIVHLSRHEQVAFANVVGDLDLGTLFKLATKFDGEDWEDMLEGMDGKHGIKVNKVEVD